MTDSSIEYWQPAPGLDLGFRGLHARLGSQFGVETSAPPPTINAPPPLPSRSTMEQLFKEGRLAAEVSAANNFSPSPYGGIRDTGYTGGGGVRIAWQGQCSSVGAGGDLKLFTEYSREGSSEEVLGVHRDDEARVYASFQQQGTCIQPVVDRFQNLLPWANITTVSLEERIGGAGSGNWGGLPLQELLHRNTSSGGTLEERSLADQYPGRRKANIYLFGSAYVGSRFGEGPLTVGIRTRGQLAPAGTSDLTAGLEFELEKNDFYVSMGISGSIQQSALGDFHGAPRNGFYPTVFGAAGYGVPSTLGSRFEVRIVQNPQGTGLGFSSLADDRNLAIIATGQLTTETLRALVRMLWF